MLGDWFKGGKGREIKCNYNIKNKIIIILKITLPSGQRIISYLSHNMNKEYFTNTVWIIKWFQIYYLNINTHVGIHILGIKFSHYWLI